MKRRDMSNLELPHVFFLRGLPLSTSAKFLGFWTPFPPCPHRRKTVCLQNRPIFGPPPPLGADVLNGSPPNGIASREYPPSLSLETRKSQPLGAVHERDTDPTLFEECPREGTAGKSLVGIGHRKCSFPFIPALFLAQNISVGETYRHDALPDHVCLIENVACAQCHLGLVDMT